MQTDNHNQKRSELTLIASRISKMKFVINRMHFQGHIDPWCKEHCYPNRASNRDDKVVIYHAISTNINIILCIDIGEQ